MLIPCCATPRIDGLIPAGRRASDRSAEFALLPFPYSPVRLGSPGSCARIHCIYNAACHCQSYRACAFVYCHCDNSSSYRDNFAHLSEPSPKNGPDKRRGQSPEELARLFQLGEKLYAENQPVAVSTLEDFDRDRFARFYEAKYSESAPDPSIDSGAYLRTLENLELVVGNRVTVAGLLLFGKRLPVLLPEMKVDAVWFKGSEKSSDEWWDQRIITGTLPEQYDGGMSFLKRWNSRVQSEGSFNQVGRPEVPDIVFEELLINALIHRDYFIKDSIKAFIFDDRIEIRSPGKLPNSLTVEQIRRGLRRSRNVLLASFAPELLNYRGIGSGVLRALKSWPSISWFNDTDGDEVVATIHLTQPST